MRNCKTMRKKKMRKNNCATFMRAKHTNGDVSRTPLPLPLTLTLFSSLTARAVVKRERNTERERRIAGTPVGNATGLRLTETPI